MHFREVAAKQQYITLVFSSFFIVYMSYFQYLYSKFNVKPNNFVTVMLTVLFQSVPDHRVVNRCTYRLDELLTIALLTYLCGGEDYADMEAFAETRARQWGLLQDNTTSPSYDTFERLMKCVEPKEIERCLITYGKQFLDSVCEKQIAIDGKKLRGAQPASRGTEGDYILNAFVSENQIVIGQLAVSDKQNEITAIPEMLDKIDIRDATVTIDAIGTQVGIAQKIVNKGGHYLLPVKQNQKLTYEAVDDAFRFYGSKESKVYEEKNVGHGRIEVRTCRILPAERIADSQIRERWEGLKTVVEITSKVCYDGDDVITKRLYISDEDYANGKYYYELARGHWAIENNLHWHLDVTFKEDDSRVRTGYAPQNLSMIRKLALQIIKNHQDNGKKKRSLKKKLFIAAMDPDYLLQIIKNANF